MSSETGDPRGVRLRLLGGFELRRDGRPRSLPLSAQRVAAFVALHPGPVQRIYVAASLWPDSREDRAHASLRTALWRLGRVGGPVLTATATQVAVAPTTAVDVHEAAARAKRLVRGTGPPDPNDLARLCDVGEVLPDWYDEWVLFERERFNQLRLHALESLCEECVRRGRFGEASEAGLAAVAAEPLRESAHRAVIASHLAEGNPADAIRHFNLYRALAQDRLGLEPSARMLDLVRGLPVDLGVPSAKE
jgi:DNA-binding SARP family transcriptional activator